MNILIGSFVVCNENKTTYEYFCFVELSSSQSIYKLPRKLKHGKARTKQR